MAEYDQLKSTLQSNVYQNSANAVTGAVMQSTLMAFINTIGVGSGYMGMLSSGNKPTAAVDGKQFYIGMNSGSTSVTVNCSSVGLGNIVITQRTLWVVWSDGTGWHKQDLAAGLSAVIPTNVNQLTGYDTLLQKEGMEEYEGDAAIDGLESNKAYVVTNGTGLTVSGYAYDVSSIKECISLPETHIVVVAAGAITISAPAGSMLKSGQTWDLDAGNTYLITVKGIFWKIEQYV